MELGVGELEENNYKIIGRSPLQNKATCRKQTTFMIIKHKHRLRAGHRLSCENLAMPSTSFAKVESGSAQLLRL